jgi:hypothetical protein
MAVMLSSDACNGLAILANSMLGLVYYMVAGDVLRGSSCGAPYPWEC